VSYPRSWVGQAMLPPEPSPGPTPPPMCKLAAGVYPWPSTIGRVRQHPLPGSPAPRAPVPCRITASMRKVGKPEMSEPLGIASLTHTNSNSAASFEMREDAAEFRAQPVEHWPTHWRRK
jgi:hypothetical protein